MIKNIGIIGVGHFAGYLVEGFSVAAPEIKIVLSPRSKDKSQFLAQKFNCDIADNNQDVIDRSDIIILSIKPIDLKDVIKDLNFTKKKLVISVVAGSDLNELSSLVEPANVVCSLPLSSAAINKSATLLYPHQNDAFEVLSLLGSVITCKSQQEFNTSGAFSAFYGWNFKFMAEMSKWGENNGLSRDMSRKIVEQIFEGSAGMSAKESEFTLDQIISNVATKGGITELGLNIIEQQNSFKALHDAMDAVRKRLSG
ncbi:MAG: NAD(P)-binding domain-containing protein [Kordiimonadaceae bacterium]|jgi:pyrroline-5-carboxylate reductase|nr:NAD(P)-binding domain-containing protein [Kordiimonadaceae bacterium]